jgi:hypothetical protein
VQKSRTDFLHDAPLGNEHQIDPRSESRLWV